MHIVENYNVNAGKKYCYACECIWNKLLRKYDKPRTSIGHIEGSPPSFVPNRFFAQLLTADPSSTGERDKLIINAAVKKYGEGVLKLGAAEPAPTNGSAAIQTTRAVFIGPAIVFGGITKRYRLDVSLRKAFGEDSARDILSLAWYMAAEGTALSDSDAWLACFENPRGCPISSQDITRLLDSMDVDGIMTFYKEWLASIVAARDK